MSSIDQAEIDQFSSHAGDWWNPDGALRPLHKMNPVRLAYIRDAVCDHFGRDSLKELSILDIGCGGGILCEPLARMGANVTGLDASPAAIDTARAHAAQAGLKISYLCGSAENHLRHRPQLASRLSHPTYDVITALEILEHVADIDSLLAAIANLLKPGGIVIFSTVNRTPTSFLLGIVAAEYILRWVPRGTHDWRKFIKPSELAAHLQKAGLSVADIAAMQFDPLNDRFHLRRNNASLNYLMSAVKP